MWVDLRHTKTKITGPFYTYCQIHFFSGNALMIICNYLGRPAACHSGPLGRV